MMISVTDMTSVKVADIMIASNRLMIDAIDTLSTFPLSRLNFAIKYFISVAIPFCFFFFFFFLETTYSTSLTIKHKTNTIAAKINLSNLSTLSKKTTNPSQRTNLSWYHLIFCSTSLYGNYTFTYPRTSS